VDWLGLEWGQVTGFCEHGNESSKLIEGGKFLY
jgi:hypothetical protein